MVCIMTCPEFLASPPGWEQFQQHERSLLHVAATRAKKRVVVSFSGKPSPFLGRS